MNPHKAWGFDMTSDYAKRVRKIREALGLTQIEFADAIGASQGRVSKWERGENKPSTEHWDQIIKLAGTDGRGLEGVVPLGAGGSPPRTYRIVGEVQAGVWMEAIEWEYDDQIEVALTPPAGLEHADVKGFRVRGSSMNKIYNEGTVVYVQPTISNGIEPKSGQYVLVSRRNNDGLYEATLKEFVVDDSGRRWLWPRSHDPRYQAPVALDNGEAEEVTVTGIVRFAVMQAP